MQRKISLMAILFFVLSLGVMSGDDSGNVVQKARELEQAGELEEAVALLEDAYQKSPEDVTICATLGFYKGMMAGKTQDFMEAGQLIGEAFPLLDKAVSLAENATLPRFYRGILCVNTPEFLGKLDQGIADLEYFMKLAQEPSRKIASSMLYAGLMNLAKGYEKKNQLQKAIDSYTQALSQTENDSEKKRIATIVERLNEKLTGLAGPEKPATAAGNTEEMLESAREYIREEKWENARKVLKEVIAKDPENLPALRLQVKVVSHMAGTGYDEHIYTDTDYRTNLAFEIVNLTEKICKLAPKDMEMRLLKGAIAVEMPFFVNKLDQGIVDLKGVLEGDSTDEQKAQALYYLGLAHQKIKTTYWIKVAQKYGKTKAAKSVFAGLMPAIKRISEKELTPPCLKIEFILGFQDELAPQTAVWIEDADGEFVKTVYVSGFCGHAREKQVDLPQWGKRSEFRDVDGVTAASIDRGHHIYVWDLKDFQGKTVQPGEYRVRVETHFWPSEQYQRTETAIRIGKKSNHAEQKKGNLIPFLRAEYYSGN